MSRPRIPGRLLKPLASFPALLGLLIVCGTALAYPKPASVPFRWEMDFEPGPLRLYVDPIDGNPYWYFTYQVINKTGEDQLWAPSFDLFTDRGQVLNSGRNVPLRVEESIRDLLGNPLIERENEAIGEIFQGREHAKDGLIVWRADHTDVNELSLYIAGISGETARVRNPVSQKDLILRKTLERNYLIRGSALARGSKPIELVDERWVMR